jgi:hypothetical protein
MALIIADPNWLFIWMRVTQGNRRVELTENSSFHAPQKGKQFFMGYTEE